MSLEDAHKAASVPLRLPNQQSAERQAAEKVEDGQQIRLKGQGMASPMGGEPGDAIVTVKFERHKLFRRDGADLRVEVPITLYEAVLGGKVRVPTLDGSAELTLPANINTAKALRLKGKGLHGAGDLYAAASGGTWQIAIDSSDAEMAVGAGSLGVFAAHGSARREGALRQLVSGQWQSIASLQSAIPTAIAESDGRLFVVDNSNRQVRVIKSGVRLPTPALTFAAEEVDRSRESRVAVDRVRPNFAANGYRLPLLHPPRPRRPQHRRRATPPTGS